jgi:hypothetical protein
MGTRQIRIIKAADMNKSGLTVDVPIVWDATTNPPVAAAGPNGTATLTFPPPSSPNGPFTYGLAANGGGTFGAQEVDVAGNLVFPITGLTAGQEYSWTPNVTTQYSDDGTVNALPSNTITGE